MPQVIHIDQSHARPDIIALGFQEIVPLTAQQVLQTDPERRRMWEALILKTINGRPRRQNTYIPIGTQQVCTIAYCCIWHSLTGCGQLVGTAILILVKEPLSAEIRGVDSATHKVIYFPEKRNTSLTPVSRPASEACLATRVPLLSGWITTTPASAS